MVVWFIQRVNNICEKASPSSLLTASADYASKGQLKVYYNKDNDPAMRCAWVTLGDGTWTTRPIL